MLFEKVPLKLTRTLCGEHLGARVGGSDNEESTDEVEEHDREMLERIPFIDTHEDHTTHIARRRIGKKVPFVMHGIPKLASDECEDGENLAADRELYAAFMFSVLSQESFLSMKSKAHCGSFSRNGYRLRRNGNGSILTIAKQFVQTRNNSLKRVDTVECPKRKSIRCGASRRGRRIYASQTWRILARKNWREK